ncbi:hypothetical protein BDR04DRAFT_1163385 [Suillus decipiens]|nr:hypothetical protein BDR04DRAFT_1163385 [Suillus decipiens]
MPSPVHEAVIKFITKGLERLDDILLDFIAGKLLSSETHTNLTIDEKSVICIPDILHVVTALTNPPTVIIPIMGEVAVSQSRADLLERLRNRIKAFPSIALLFIAEVQEWIPYSPPKRSSNAWKKLRKEEEVRSYHTFYSDDTPRSYDIPTEIEVERHTWHAMSTVHFQVWVQGKDGRIDIDTQDPNLTTRGQLFPKKSMDNVTLMMERGLFRMREQYAHLCQRVSPNTDVMALLAVPVTFPFVWDGMLEKLSLACMSMAHNRYKAWYDEVGGSKGVKRTAEEAFYAGPARGTRSRTRARTAALGRGQSLP